MTGGAGNDFYFVDNPATPFENAGEERTDTMLATTTDGDRDLVMQGA